jgi:hypothetical protein
VLRFHPVVFNIFRQAGEEDVLPLSTPLTLSTGEVVRQLVIPKGTNVMLSLAAYHRFVSAAALCIRALMGE